MPSSLPEWVPWWAVVAVLVPALLYLLLLLIMPFSVFGLRGRLNAIDLRLDEIQGEIRILALRLPDVGERSGAPSSRPEAERPPMPPLRRSTREQAPPDEEATEFGSNEGRSGRYEQRNPRPRRSFTERWEPRLDGRD